MKLLIFLFGILGCAFGHQDLDWSKIKPKYVTVDPVPNAPHYPQSRIVGGYEAEPNTLPYQAAVIVDFASLCGGILISSQHVLSAAHCTVGASLFQVILGAHYISQNESSQLIVNSEQVVNHPGYNATTLSDDISIIILPITITLTEQIRTVPLAPVSAGDFSGALGVLSGWGTISDDSNVASPTLQWIQLLVLSNQECAEYYGNRILDSHICTSGSGFVGACQGDSGGPLVASGYVIGVVAFGDPLCAAGNPTAYTRITSYRSWINEVAGV